MRVEVGRNPDVNSESKPNDPLDAILRLVCDRVADRLRDVVPGSQASPPTFVTVTSEAVRRGCTPRELRATCRALGVPLRQDGPKAWVCPSELDKALGGLPTMSTATTGMPSSVTRKTVSATTDNLDRQVALACGGRPRRRS